MNVRIGIIQNVTLNDHRSVHSHYVACELVKRGFDVDLIVQKTSEKLQYTTRPYTLIQLPGKTYSMAGQIKFISASFLPVKKNKYHIIHAKNPFSSIFSPVILKNIGILPSKIIYDIRGLWIDFGIMSKKIPLQLGRILKHCENHLVNQCHHVVVISPQLKKMLFSQAVNTDKISVVFGDGVDIQTLRLIKPAKNLKSGYKATIGYIGTISVFRQSDKIIKAFKKINRDDIRLIMVGPIIEPQIFRNLTEGCENIELTGFMAQEDAFRYLKSFDIALSYHDTDHPVYNVAVPTKVMEYMAAGIPIVATKHCMYTNLLKDGRTAVLTEFPGFCQGDYLSP